METLDPNVGPSNRILFRHDGKTYEKVQILGQGKMNFFFVTK